jgi:hypothetical protein
MPRALIALILFLVAVLPLQSADDEVDARRLGLELAGAFSNDGFKLRDGIWTGSLKAGESKIVSVSLYAGNLYWFSFGVVGNAKAFHVAVFDETGKEIEGDRYSDDGKIAAAVAPQFSGQYFVRVKLAEGEPARFCMVYSYK